MTNTHPIALLVTVILTGALAGCQHAPKGARSLVDDAINELNRPEYYFTIHDPDGHWKGMWHTAEALRSMLATYKDPQTSDEIRAAILEYLPNFCDQFDRSAASMQQYVATTEHQKQRAISILRQIKCGNSHAESNRAPHSDDDIGDAPMQMDDGHHFPYVQVLEAKADDLHKVRILFFGHHKNDPLAPDPVAIQIIGQDGWYLTVEFDSLDIRNWGVTKHTPGDVAVEHHFESTYQGFGMPSYMRWR